MTIPYQIEYTTPQGEYDILDVDLLGDLVVEDDSYDDAFGTVKTKAYPVLEEVKWVKTEFSDEQNELIEKHVTENFAKIEALFIKRFNETND